MTKIKQDFLGLYAVAGGWIARPKNITNLNVGDEVSTYHHGGSTMVSVKEADGKKQHWTTTGLSSYKYQIVKKKLSQQDFENIVKISSVYYLINNPLYPQLSSWHGKNYVDYRNENVSKDFKWYKEILDKTLTEHYKALESKKNKLKI